MATAIYYGLYLISSAKAGSSERIQPGWLPIVAALAFDASAIYWFIAQ